MHHRQSSANVAALIAEVLSMRDVERVFGLCGGHIMPIWMALDAIDIAIVDAREERDAAMIGIANAHVSRATVPNVSGTVPRPQVNRGALQDLDQASLVHPIKRRKPFRPTPNRGSPGCQISNPWPPGTRPSGHGAQHSA